MASGQPVVQILEVLPPTTVFATPDVRPGGSTVVEAFTVWDFDGGSTVEYLDLKCVLKGYAGGGLTFRLPWSATSGSPGTRTVRWEIAIRRLEDDAEDIDAAHTYDYNGTSDDEASVLGEASYASITFTNGADMDSWADGEMAIVRVRRDPTHADDDLTSIDAELWGLFGYET